MSWMQKLYQTYEFVQKQNLDDKDLALPFHMSKAVHLKVILNEQGEMIGAERLNKKQVPIQVTEKSLKRSGSTIAPYALDDSLQYIAKTAGDYLTIEYLSQIAEKKAPQKGGKKWQKFLSDTIEEKQNFAEKEILAFQKSFEDYEKQLSDWAKVSNLQEIGIVLQYVQKGTLIEDLISQKILSFEENILSSNVDKDDPFNWTIIWAIATLSDVHAELWSKDSIKNEWIEYQENQTRQGKNQKDLCCITGKEDYPAEAYPKIQGNAKLVSANDQEGFTFRGRFYGKNDGADSVGRQAAFLGKNISQKAFSTLKWLINRQGIRNGKQTILVWSSNCYSDEDKNLSYPYKNEEGSDNIYDFLLSKENIDQSADLGLKAAEKFKSKLRGYQEKLVDSEQISLLVVDEPSKTGGRMSLTFYQEKLRDDYFNDLNAWQDDFSWYHPYKSGWIFLAPSLKRIAETVLTRAEFEDKDMKAQRQLYSTLLPVISGGKTVPIPYNLVEKAIRAACNPFSYQKTKEDKRFEENRKEHWERNLSVACALYKGWHIRHHRSSKWRTYNMNLEITNPSRDYLFGRLLAVAEEIESKALSIAKEDRATNAERYMQRFAVRPLSTWMQIALSLENYKDRLRKDYPIRISDNFVLKNPIGFLRNREAEITELTAALDKFRAEGFDLNEPLNGEFLLGYHSQKIAYRNKSKTPSEQNEIQTNK